MLVRRHTGAATGKRKTHLSNMSRHPHEAQHRMCCKQQSLRGERRSHAVAYSFNVALTHLACPEGRTLAPPPSLLIITRRPLRAAAGSKQPCSHMVVCAIGATLPARGP